MQQMCAVLAHTAPARRLKARNLMAHLRLAPGAHGGLAGLRGGVGDEAHHGVHAARRGGGVQQRGLVRAVGRRAARARGRRQRRAAELARRAVLDLRARALGCAKGCLAPSRFCEGLTSFSRSGLHLPGSHCHPAQRAVLTRRSRKTHQCAHRCMVPAP